jgi:DNA-binding NtrC family response regulator
LEGFIAELPPLERRREDFGGILSGLLAKALGDARDSLAIRPAAGRALCFYDWPLNIRELEQCLLRALALAGGGAIEKSHLPAVVADAADQLPSKPRPEGPRAAVPPSQIDDKLLREQLIKSLTEHNGNVARVADAMGKARAQIHRWMKRLGVDPDTFRRPP